MDKREQLLEKVEQNYKTFLEELEDYDVDNIVTNSVYIYLMTETHHCIKEGYILNKEEDIDYFLKRLMQYVIGMSQMAQNFAIAFQLSSKR